MSPSARYRPCRDDGFYLILCLLVLVGLGGCGRGCDGRSSGPSAGGVDEPRQLEGERKAAVRRTPGPPARGVDELRYLEGEREDEVREALGPPASESKFTMAQCCSEFEIELYNTYPPDDGKHAKVRIRQLDWDYEGYRVTLWLHQRDGEWVVLETSRYSDNVEF